MELGGRRVQGAFSSFWAVIVGCLVVEKPDLPPRMATSVFGWWAHVGPKSCLAVPGCPAAGHMAPDRRVHMSQPQPASHLLPPASQNRKSLAFSCYQLHAPLPLSSGWGSHAPPSSSSVDHMEGVDTSPDCPQSWTNGCHQREGLLFSWAGSQVGRRPNTFCVPCNEPVFTGLIKRGPTTSSSPTPPFLLSSIQHKPRCGIGG